MNIEHIIVQAGGKGNRLGYLTANKPKALVPVENLPMLFHLFRKYPNKKFVIVADYKKEVLREYLESFATVKYQVVDAQESGTCGGIKQAIDLLPDNESFMLIWSDLILPETFLLPNEPADYIGISQTFTCRWQYINGEFSEKSSREHGVAGLFIFKNKSALAQLPESGEFVRWIQGQKLNFNELGLAGTREFGLLVEYENLAKEKCRPFNKMTTDDNMIIKEPIDEQGKKLAQLECEWYKKANEIEVKNIPCIYSTNPLKMERINGRNIYEYTDLILVEKRAVLQKLVTALKSLHNFSTNTTDTFSMKEAYYNKTMDRLQKIRYLVPLANKKTININGKECPNVYYYKRDLERKLESLPTDSFTFIHGDCTFSNLMMKDDTTPIFIDPRGYFGHTKLYGDPNYDWAKLYYSVVGNYDRFNLKDFRLVIENETVNLKIESNQWEELESDFFALSGTDPKVIKLIHAIIWLSLTTYAWQDYDSVCGAFYNGLYHLEGIL
ncbi:MAG: NTP transferase domain-containing protein [Defluviitaleaceae bacterium]|nr:NTP transferase domain-containing protein [Defluviitaleaceae bacterium]